MVKFSCVQKEKTIYGAIVIGVEERGLYRLKGHVESSLMTSTINPCELWQKIISHVHYKGLPIESKVVTSLPKIQIGHEGVCKGCAQGKNTKNPYPNSDNKEKWILDIIHSYICGPMRTTSLSGYVYYDSFIDD